MDQYESKLKKLREKYTDPGSQQGIDDDEKRLRILIVQKDFLSNEIVQEMVRDAKSKIEDINFLLAYNDDLNQPDKSIERRALFRERNVWNFLLERFGVDQRDVENQISTLVDELDQQTQR